MTAEPRFTAASYTLLAFAIHGMLALVVNTNQTLATAHALGILCLGLFFWLRDQTPERVLYIVGYVIGAEVFWRMSEARILWEFGKYAIVLLIILVGIKHRLRIRPLPILYLLLVLPGTILLIGEVSLSKAKDVISFNLSGHIAIIALLLYFTNIKLNQQQLQKLLWFTLLPITGTGIVILYDVLTANSIRFITESNFATSGDYAPNQVSVILGLGALLCLFYIINVVSETKIYWFWFSIGVWLLAQAVLTFSRGGVFGFVIAACAGIIIWVRNKRNLVRLIIGISIAVLVSVYFILPRLNSYTGGVLQQRYAERTATGRTELIQAEIRTWLANPVFGVGVGQAASWRRLALGLGVATHTEYTRLLAEQGIFGLCIILLYGLITLQILRAHAPPQMKGIAFACIIWSLFTMTHAAMRLAAISFLIGLPIGCLPQRDELSSKQ